MNKRITGLVLAFALLFLFATSCGNQKGAVQTDNKKSVIDDNEEYYSKYMKTLDCKSLTYRPYVYQGVFKGYVCDDDISEDKIEYTVTPVSITPIVDLASAGIDTDELFKDYYGVYSADEKSADPGDVDVKVERGSIKYDDCIDEKKHRVKDGFVFILVEYEVNNIRADFRFFEDDNIENSELYFDMLTLYPLANRNDNMAMMSLPIYIEQYGLELSEMPEAIKIEKGTSRKICVGYILKDETDTPCTEVLLLYNSNFGYLVYDIYSLYKFDISKEVKAVLAAS